MDSQNTFHPTRKTTLSEISKRSKLSFPRGARLLAGEIMSQDLYPGSKPTLSAKIRIDKSELAGFLASVPKPRNESTSERVLISADRRVRWWNPDSCRKFRAIRSTHGGTYIVLVGLDAPSVATVYLQYYRSPAEAAAADRAFEASRQWSRK
jgi:hypothetical protein